MVDFEILLERNEYAVGETAKGTLVISEDKDFKVQGFEFSVSGAERIEMKSDENLSKTIATRTFDESNIFFSKDLSHYLNSIGTKVEDGMLEVPRGITKVPFEFYIRHSI
jgi:hypothetical protein